MALVVDNWSYHSTLKNHKCSIFSFDINNYPQEIGSKVMTPHAISLFKMPIHRAQKLKKLLERRGLIGRVSIIKCK